MREGDGGLDDDGDHQEEEDEEGEENEEVFLCTFCSKAQALPDLSSASCWLLPCGRLSVSGK